MKESQIPKKNFARSSEPGTKKFKDSELKNRKIAEKSHTKVPVDFTSNTQTSVAISDSQAESIIMQGSSLDLSSAPEISLLSPVSTVTSVDAHIDSSSTDWIQSITELPASVQSLRVEINDLKNMIYSVDTSEERNWIDGIVAMKFRIVLLSFILWTILAAIVFFFSSGDEVAYHGPLPT